jgi:hypothetical protein
MNARMERICLSGTLLAALIASAGCFGGGDDDDDVVDPECVLEDENERSPGYPFDFEVFKTDIAATLVANCTAGNCHLPGEPPTGANGGYIVWAGAADNDCDRVKTFKAFRDKSDLTNPPNSLINTAINGALPTHPLKTVAAGGTLDDATAAKLLNFIVKANADCVADGGCAPSTGVDYFDPAVFESTIQPALDAAGNNVGCSAGANCHAPPTGQGLFVFTPGAAAGSAEIKANYEAVKNKISLTGDVGQDPTKTVFYIQATTVHGGGVSTQVNAAGATALADFIAKAIAAKGNVDPGNNTGCADPAQLSLDVWIEEIFPILTGEIDLNDQNGEGNAVGCARPTCHGVARPGALTLLASDPPEKQLANFACFVNLASPSSSPVLACPSDNNLYCPKDHEAIGGGRVFADANDNNYERILSYLFSANSDNIPLDFAFFALRIDSIFNNRNAVEDGAQGRTCADTNSCHGVLSANQRPPNNSNFGIIPNAGKTVNLLKVNFTEAASMINFQTAEGSSLFLYPTNAIADPDNFEFATGTVHPGGADFAVDSAFAADILKFAAGLRPNGAGEQLNWLIGGAFQGVADIDDTTLIDEDNITPEVFQASGGDELAGEWDAFFSVDGRVDVQEFIGGESLAGRTVFAVAYLVNQTTIDQRVEVELTPENDAKLFVGESETQVNANNTGSLTLTIPASRASDTPVANRIMVKLFQAAGQANLAFTIRLLRADNDQPFNDVGRELVIKLDPRGGI